MNAPHSASGGKVNTSHHHPPGTKQLNVKEPQDQKCNHFCQQYTDTSVTPILGLVRLEQTLKCRQVLIPHSEDDFWRPQSQGLHSVTLWRGSTCRVCHEGVTAPSCTEQGGNYTLLLKSSSHAVFPHRLLAFVQTWRFAGVQSPAVSQLLPSSSSWPASPFCFTLPLLNYWPLTWRGFLRRLVRKKGNEIKQNRSLENTCRNFVFICLVW